MLFRSDFKNLFWALYDYQLHDVKPPEFKGEVDILASLIIPQLKRRKDKVRAGSLGGKATQKNASLQAAENDCLLEANGQAEGQAEGQANCQADCEAHNKNININTNTNINHSINKRSSLASKAVPSDTAYFQDEAEDAGERESGSAGAKESGGERRSVATKTLRREHKGSFDTDEFFDAAVRRSLGDL